MGRESSCPGSGQRKFESRHRAEQFRVQAADRAGSSQGTGRLAETKRRERGPVHSVSSTQASYNAKRVLAQSMPNLYPNLEAEVASPDNNTANMTENISLGEALKFVATFKGEKMDVLAFIANVYTY